MGVIYLLKKFTFGAKVLFPGFSPSVNRYTITAHQSKRLLGVFYTLLVGVIRK